MIQEIRVARASMGRCREDDPVHALQDIRAFGPRLFLTLQIEHDLFDDQTAEAVADEND